MTKDIIPTKTLFRQLYMHRIDFNVANAGGGRFLKNTSGNTAQV